MTRIDLPDVNVWLALGVPDHAHHERAKRYWDEESAAEVGFCRITALAFVRLCTRPAVMGNRPASVGEAWQGYLAFRELSGVVFLREPEGCERDLGHWASGSSPSCRLWTDAYLAAFARTEGCRLVTFDRDFERFPELDLLRLES